MPFHKRNVVFSAFSHQQIIHYSPFSHSEALILLKVEINYLLINNFEGLCIRGHPFCQVSIQSTSSSMLLNFHKTKQPQTLFLAMILLVLTNEANCVREIRSKPSTTEMSFIFHADFHSGTDERDPKGFCVDSDGVRHGLFSSWRDLDTGCQCICQSIGRAFISVCDEECPKLQDEMREVTSNFLTQNGESVSSLIYQDLSNNKNANKEMPNHLGKSCHDSTSGDLYMDGQSWMSILRPCAKCFCLNGTTDCENTVLHCQSSCLPGQTSISSGPCCDHTCVGDPIAQTNEVLTASCISPKGRHAEVVFIRQQCVDQRCQCINGHWFCLNTCTPLDELKCPPEERIFWDPFCCPRCKGTKKCTVSVKTIDWMERVPDRKGLPMFMSVFTSEGEKQILNTSIPSQPSRLRHLGHADRRRTTFDHATSIITVDPAQHLVTHAGRCVCTDGELRCSRPGPGVWQETDCYYSHGQYGRYYALGDHWKSYDDDCSDCHCLEGRRYTCARTLCSALFLCPSGKVPVSAPGDCCPSTCEDGKQVEGEKKTYRLPDMTHSKEVEIVRPPNNPITPPVTDSKKDRCKPLGDLTSSSDGASNILLPSESLVIIRRACVSLRCICSIGGNWVCQDYCIPCHGVSNENSNAVNALGLSQIRTSDSCCPKCSASTNSQEEIYIADRYSAATSCILALLAVTPLFVIIICCICLRHRRKIKRIRSSDLNQGKFRIEGRPPTPSLHSSLAVPLTISTNVEEGHSTEILSEKATTAFSGRDSLHQSLLFNVKISHSPSNSIYPWRSSTSYNCLQSSSVNVHNSSAITPQSTNQFFGESTLPKSTMTSSDQILKFDSFSDAPVDRQAFDETLSTNSPVTTSSVRLEREEQTISVALPDTLSWRLELRRSSTKCESFTDTPVDQHSFDRNTSTSSPGTTPFQPHETERQMHSTISPDSLVRRPQLRRSSTQPRTHFFPLAWRTMISQSAAVSPLRKPTGVPFFVTEEPVIHNESPAQEDIHDFEPTAIVPHNGMYHTEFQW